jgi:signal transduction histidine kinase
MGVLVESLLDVTRIQAGPMQLQLEACDLSQLIHDVVSRLEPDASRAGSPVTQTGDTPLNGVWDRLRLDQVLTNLLSNAVKYGAGLPITIDARADGSDCLVTVSDQGIGIPAADLLRIFEPFELAVSPQHYGGLGLGLYIAQRIVEGHGGTIWAAITPGGGTTMHVRLPLRPAAEPDSGG